jgi:hypothetical protein
MGTRPGRHSRDARFFQANADLSRLAAVTLGGRPEGRELRTGGNARIRGRSSQQIRAPRVGRCSDSSEGAASRASSARRRPPVSSKSGNQPRSRGPCRATQAPSERCIGTCTEPRGLDESYLVGEDDGLERVVRASSAGGGSGLGAGKAGELFDHPSGHRRREERIAGGPDPDGVDQLLGGGILDQEAACTGPQRFIDVLVELERGEDQNSRRRLVSGQQAAGRLEPVEVRHADVHQRSPSASRSKGRGKRMTAVRRRSALCAPASEPDRAPSARGQPASSSLRTSSMNAVSTGLTPPPAKCPHTPGITRSSAFGMCETAYSSSSGGK